MSERRFFVMGGGGFSMEPDNPVLDDYLLSLVVRADRLPKVCFVPTASGDSVDYVERFRAAFPNTRAETSVLSLFKREVADLESFVGAQDVVYVGGGNTANLLAIWRLHGLDVALERASERGVVLAGISAGMNCWFESSITDSFDIAGGAPLNDGLAMLPGSACPHYSNEPARRPAYLAQVGSGFPGGHAADDGVGLLFEGGQLIEAVSSRPEAKAFRVILREGAISEEVLPVRVLPAVVRRRPPR